MMKQASEPGKAQARTDIGENPLYRIEESIICATFQPNNRRGYKLTGKGSYPRLLP